VGALSDVKILDLTRLLPGGFCTLLLADLGAEVLKVEDTGMGDYVRWAPPYCEGAEDSAKSALYLALNRGKRSVRLNLKEAAGREVLLRLVAAYDVVVEGFRPGQTGPYTARSGHDMNYLRLVGMLDLGGPVDGPPVQAAGTRGRQAAPLFRPHRLRRLRLGSGPRWAMEYTRTGAARRRRRRASASPAPKLEASSPTA
jgi:crotonobetainyl-CoA:carnitine CoA-transferase CaiB-like acyl-CoA transferase